MFKCEIYTHFEIGYILHKLNYNYYFSIVDSCINSYQKAQGMFCLANTIVLWESVSLLKSKHTWPKFKVIVIIDRWF